MLFREFPDIKWLKAKIDQDFGDRKGWGGVSLEHTGWPTVIMNARAKYADRSDIKGTLSLFSNFQGNSVVKVEGRNTLVNERFLFLTNQDQLYSLAIDQREPVETFNLHFGTHFLTQARKSLLFSDHDLLDTAASIESSSMNFFNRLIPKDEFAPLLKAVHRTASEGCDFSMLLEEQLYALVVRLIEHENETKKLFLRLPVLKHATRKEIGRRLLFAVDFMHSYLHQRISLDHLAAVSCLSKFHFLRLFKAAFQESPHQYLTELRLKKAYALLRNSSYPLQEIALQVGFENPSSFTRLFLKKTGMSPSTFRIAAGN